MSTSPETRSSTASPPLPAVWPWLAVAAALVTFRSLPYVLWPTVDFDADQAVVGLMAKHVAEWRALPVYQYGLPYVLMVSAYVTAPFMWVLGATPAALKLPVLLMNGAVGVGTVLAIVRAGVRPAVSVLLALPVLLPAPVAGAGLMDAIGMTVEPALFVLALWGTRHLPLAFGVIAAVGFHVREFVAYGVAAALAIAVLRGGVLSSRGRRHWSIAAVAALGTAAFIGGLARFGSVRGPGTWLASEFEGNLGTLGAAFCFVPARAVVNLGDLVVSYLGVLWGPVPMPLTSAAVHSGVTQGLPWAWPALGSLLALVAARSAWSWRRLWDARETTLVQFGTFLALVGAQAVLVYAVSRCGDLSVLTIRYALLGVFLPTGLALLCWAAVPHARWRGVLALTVGALGLLNAWPQAQLWRELATSFTPPNRVQLSRALEAQGIRFARSDYWTAYYVDFVSQERVIVGADTLSRVDIYEHALAQHAAEVVRIATTPCGDTPPIVPGFYICRAQP